MDDFEKLKEYKLHNAPVPSYEELKQKIHILTESQMSLENTIGELTDELQELKSKRDKLAYDLGVADTKNGELLRLLKECQEIIEWYKADCGYKDLPTESVLTKIEKVLK